MTSNLWPDELKILVIDDEQEILNLIRLSLETAGFIVLRTTDPEEGLSIAMREHPDLLLLDIMMPELDGLELLRRIRRHQKVGEIPVIIVSALSAHKAYERTLKLFDSQEDIIDAYLRKPFDAGRLLGTVKEVLLKNKDYLLEKNKRNASQWAWQRHA